MINKYKNQNKELKEYKVSRVKQGTAKNGCKYTMLQISDPKKQENGQYIYDYYGVFSWQQDLVVEDGDKIVFEDITAIEIVENEWNGKKTIKRTIFADVRVSSPATPNKVEVVGDLPDISAIDDDILPF